MSNLLRALIVEDSQDDAVMLLRELRRAGYEVISERVETAEGLNAALDRAEWDVVLSDYTMPHFSAPGALAVLKNRQLDLPFIIISGTIGEETAVNAMKAGAQDFLIKGKLARLFPALERELGEAQGRRERRRAEEALRDSESRYRTLFERNLAGVLCVTLDGRVLECNQAMADMLGFPSSREVRNLRVLDFYYSHEDRARFLEKLEAEGRLTNHELHWRRKDGSSIWLLTNVSLINQTPSGQRIIEGTLVDITERKLAEAENSRLAAIVNSSDDAIFSVTHDGVITTWNAGAERMYGYAAEEIKGKPIEVLIPENHQSALAANRERLHRGEAVFHYEFEHMRKDGVRLQVLLTLSPIKNATGIVTGVSAISRDIAERKQAEAELQKQHDFVTAMLDSVQSGIIACDDQGVLTLFNHASREIFGLPPATVPAELWAQYYDLYLADGKTLMKKEDIPLFRALQGEHLSSLEMMIIPKHGEARAVLTSGQPIIDANGRNLGAVVAFHDITERKRTEAERTRLITAIEQSAEGVVITNLAGDIEYVNPAFTRITGYSREEALGHNPRILKSGKQDPVFYRQLWATILRGEIWHGELINQRKDGRFTLKN